MSQLHDARAIVEGLQRKSDAVRRSLVEDCVGGPDAGLAAEECEAVRATVEEMQLGIAAAQEKLAAAAQAQVREEAAHAKEVASKDIGSATEWARLLKLVEELQNERTDLAQQLGVLTDEREELQGTNERLSQELDDLRRAHQALSEQMSRAQEAWQATAEERAAARSHFEELQNERKELADRLACVNSVEREDQKSAENWRVVHNTNLGLSRACLQVGQRAGYDGSDPKMLEEAYFESRKECEELRERVRFLTRNLDRPGVPLDPTQLFGPQGAAPVDQQRAHAAQHGSWELGAAVVDPTRMQDAGFPIVANAAPGYGGTTAALSAAKAASCFDTVDVAGAALMRPVRPETLYGYCDINEERNAYGEPMRTNWTNSWMGVDNDCDTLLEQAKAKQEADRFDEPWANVRNFQLARINSEMAGLNDSLLNATVQRRRGSV